METAERGLYAGEERRQKPRNYDAFPVHVWSVDIAGRRFNTEARIENLSASGLCVSLPRRIDVGEELLAVVRFTNGDGSEPLQSVAAFGTVVRARGRPDGSCEAAVSFDRHMIL